MEADETEGVTRQSDAQFIDTSNISDMRERPTSQKNDEDEDVKEKKPQIDIVTPLAADVESIGSNNHIHVQLLDGQVIHIASTPLEEAEATGGGDRKEYVDDGRADGMGGEVVPDRGTVTLLTSNGKTYILPQHLTSAQDGNLLISDEVLAMEEILHSGAVPHEEEMLTISPPPPQSSLDFTSSVENHPDALAIATSQVFSEDYVSLPVHTQGPSIEQSKTLRLKTVDTEIPQEICDKVFTNTKTDSQRRTLVLLDGSLIPIDASDVGGSDEWLQTSSCFIPRKMVKKNGNSETLIIDESSNLAAPHGKVKEEKKCGDQIRQIQLDSASSSIHSKWHNLQSNVTSELCATPISPRTPAEQDGSGAVKSADGEVFKATKMEGAEKNIEKVSLDPNHEDNNKLEVQDKTKLRRSSRIRKVKLISCEEDVAEEACLHRRKKGMKGETPSSLWECDSCDAMFRTRVGRERHMREGHAFTCYVCGWEGHTKTKYEVHISTVHCNQQARCLACRKDFPGYEAYKQHMKEVHAAPGVSLPGTPTSASPHTTAASTTTASTTTTTTTTTASTTTTTTTTTASTTTTTATSISTAATTASTTTSTGIADDVKMEVEGGARLSHLGRDQCDTIEEKKHVPNNPDLKIIQLCGEQSCPYCGKTFTRRSRFLRHLNYHLGNRAFTCKICNKCFVEKSGLDAHLLTHCPINKECTQCGKVFKTERTMTRHLRTHLNRTYTCEFCNKQFRHEESLRVHKSVHKEGGSGNVCSVCEKDCKTPHYLQLHISTKHEAAKFTCQKCNRSFKWKQSFRKHMAIHHEDAHLKYKCNLCPRHFMTASELRVHQVVHSKEKKHLCDICGKAFKHEYTRDKHTKTVHRNDWEHMCPQCGTLFKAKAYLDQHLAHVHTTKDRVVCKYCGNNFKNEANLRSHIKIVHKPRNPKHTCTTCNKMFFAPKDLLRHSKVHTGIKEFVCSLCYRCFSRKDNMVAHLRTHAASVNGQGSAQANQQVAGTQEILGLPSSIGTNLSSGTSTNMILSNDPTTSGNIVLSEANPTNSLVLPDGPSSETPTLAAHPTSCITTVIENPVTTQGVSIATLPVSSMADISTMPTASASSIIFSTVPISSLNNVSVSSSTSTLVSSTTLAGSLVCSTANSLSDSNTSLLSGSMSAVKSSSASSSIIHLNSCSSLAPCATHPTHQAYTFHPQIVVSSPNQVSNISSLLTASPGPSTVLSLPPSHSTSAPVLVSQNTRTQMVCSTLQGEQVVLTTGPLTPIPKVSIPDDSPPKYTQLHPLSTSVCSTPSTSVNVSDNPLSPSVSSVATNLNAGVGVSVTLPANSTPHTSIVGGRDSVESNIILPTPSILQEAALILPEKSGLYTIVGGGGGGKLTPLDTLTLHPVPPPSSHTE